MDRQEPQAAAKIGIAFAVAPEADIVRVSGLGVLIGVSDNQLIGRDAPPVEELEPYTVLVLILAAADAGVDLFPAHAFLTCSGGHAENTRREGRFCHIVRRTSESPNLLTDERS